MWNNEGNALDSCDVEVLVMSDFLRDLIKHSNLFRIYYYVWDTLMFVTGVKY